MKIKLICCAILAAAIHSPAQTWQPAASPSTFWTGLACSADASVIAASDSADFYVSTNSGAAWQSNAISGHFIASVAASADGSHIYAADLEAADIACSTNSGATFTLLPVPVPFRGLACSADGSKLAGAPVSRVNAIFTSSNFGATWTSNYTVNNYWFSIASSADGSKLAAPIAFSPYVMTSADSGVTWITNLVANASNVSSLYIASSADGSRLITGGNLQTPRSVYTSSDAGKTWNPTGLTNAPWDTVASSADGSQLFAAAYTTIEYSTNNGVNWNADTTFMTNGLVTLASSADSAVLIAATGSGSPTHGPLGPIFTRTGIRPPILNITASAALHLSWLVPSTHFILQQSTDLSVNNWKPVTNTPILNLTNLQNQITLSIPTSAVYFRLATP